MKPLILALVTLIAAACHAGAHAPERAYGGDAERGRQLVRTYGCHSCHTIPGGARRGRARRTAAHRMGARVYVAGHLSNTPENLIRGIQNPPAVRQDTAMPATGVTDEDVRHIVAYLYSLK